MRSISILFFSIILLMGCQKQAIVLNIPQTNHPYLIVAHVKKPILSFIDLEKKELVHIEQLPFFAHVMVKIDERHVVLAGQNKTGVMLLDLTTGKVEPLIPSLTGITDIVYVQDKDMLLLTDILTNSVHFYDWHSKELKSSIPVGNFPVSLSLHPDLSQLFVISSEDHSVTIIDLEAEKVISTFPVIGRPTQAQYFVPDLWVGAHGELNTLNKYVHLYHPETGQLIDKIQMGVMPIAFYDDPYSAYAFVLAHGSDELFVLKKGTAELLHSINLAHNPYFITGDTDYIYVSSLDGNQLQLIEKENFTVEHSFFLAEGPYAIVIGGKINE